MSTDRSASSSSDQEAGRPEETRPKAHHSLVSIYFRGVAMGAADIVPGVSGGTMALILGIYERLIEALRSLTRPTFLGNLTRGRLADAFRAVDGLFLLVLLAGIFTSVLTLAEILSSLLESHPAFVNAFFFGLILASVVFVARRIRRPGISRWLLFAAGAVAAFLLVGLTPADTSNAPWFLFLSGALAVSALLLPGISGAFVLVLLGKYAFVLSALTRGDLSVLAIVGAGAVTGVLTFAQILGWLFRRFHDPTLALLCGIMMGSLRKIWPWQAEQGGLSVNLAPPAEFWSAQGGTGWAILLALAGALLVTVLDGTSRTSE